MTAAYTTQLGTGLGMIEETPILLDLWREGMSGPDLYRAVPASGRFSTMSARRLHDFVTVGFAPRYLSNGGTPAPGMATTASSAIQTGRSLAWNRRTS